jgi:hypothetical protein
MLTFDIGIEPSMSLVVILGLIWIIANMEIWSLFFINICKLACQSVSTTARVISARVRASEGRGNRSPIFWQRARGLLLDGSHIVSPSTSTHKPTSIQVLIFLGTKPAFC